MQPQGASSGADVDAQPTVAAEQRDARELSNVYAGDSAESARRSLDGGQHNQRIDRGALRVAIDGALVAVTPTLPLTVADAAALFDLLRQHAPTPLIREVFHDGRELVVRVFDGMTQIYERRLEPR